MKLLVLSSLLLLSVYAAGAAAAFSLVAGVDGGVEGSLGQDGSGADRPNTNRCP